jgi:acetyl-CoA carboxylase carboxyltransferase component
MSAVRIEVELRIMQVPKGGGTVMMGQSQANNPGVGPLAGPGSLGNAQMLFMNDATVVPGTSGSVTLANMLTALQTIASDFAAASGTTLITADLLAQINAWNSGSP